MRGAAVRVSRSVCTDETNIKRYLTPGRQPPYGVCFLAPTKGPSASWERIGDPPINRQRGEVRRLWPGRLVGGDAHEIAAQSFHNAVVHRPIAWRRVPMRAPYTIHRPGIDY